MGGGRFQGSRGAGRGGRGSRRSQPGRGNNKGKQNTQKSEMKFAPHYSGKQQGHTYDTVKDHIIQYVQKNLKNGLDMAETLRSGTYATPGIKPVRLIEEDRLIYQGMTAENKPSSDKMKILQDGNDIEYREELREYNARARQYEENKSKTYAIIMDYCNKTMQNRIEEVKDFELRIRNDPLELLKEIKTKMYDPARAKYEYVLITETLGRILNTKQEDGESLTDYTKRFKQSRDIMKESMGTKLFHEFAATTKEYKDAVTASERDEIVKSSFGKWTTFVFMKNSDQRKYGSLMRGFQSQYALGNNQYPTKIADGADVLTSHQWDDTYKEDVRKKKAQRAASQAGNNENSENSGTQLNQKGKELTCYCCGKKGHTVKQCEMVDKIPRGEWAINKGLQMYTKEKGDNENEDERSTNTSESARDRNVGWTGIQSYRKGMQMKQATSENDNMSNVVILDSGSMFTSIKDRKLLDNIKMTNLPLVMKTNTGERRLKEHGTLPGFKQKAWLDEDSITNIFSLAELTKDYRVTFDSNKENAFVIHTGDKKIKFACSEEGLYYYKLPENFTKQREKVVSTGVQMVNTVNENKTYHTERKIKRATVARKLYHSIGAPTIKNYKGIIRSNMIRNCPVTIEDIDLAEKIFGPDVAYIKGKTTRSKPKIVKSDQIEIPPEMKETAREVILYIDTIFINGIPFLTTIGHPMYYRTCLKIPNTTSEAYYKVINKVFRMYNKGGYTIKRIDCDGEYEPLMEKVQDDLDIEMNYANPGDHVPQAERNNRTIKECIMTALQRIAYRTIPRIMIETIAEQSATMLNMFPAKHGMSPYYSPETIVTQKRLDYDRDCKYSFGEYVIAGTQNQPTNIMTARGIDCIYL